MPSTLTKIIFNMETDDPDDFITLLMMLGHPAVDLLGVIVVPGSVEQVGLIKAAMDWFGKNLPVASLDIGVRSPSVSPWHYRAYGPCGKSSDVISVAEMMSLAQEEVTLLSGAPLTAVAAGLVGMDGRFGCLVAQGGYAGVGVVPPEKQLAKFKGVATCSSFNLSSDTAAADAVIASDLFLRKYFVSKNVCHGVYYDEELHRLVKGERSRYRYIEMIHRGMSSSADGLSKKKYHDPFALCCAIDREVAEWEEVQIYRKVQAWGCYVSPGSGTYITVDINRDRFVDTFLARGTNEEAI